MTISENLARVFVQTAIDHPEVANELKALVVPVLGVDDKKWEDIALMLVMNPKMRGATDRSATVEHPDNPDPATYLTVRSNVPTTLKTGDRVYRSPNSAMYWVVWAGAAEDVVIPAGFLFQEVIGEK